MKWANLWYTSQPAGFSPWHGAETRQLARRSCMSDVGKERHDWEGGIRGSMACKGRGGGRGGAAVGR